MPIQIPVTQVGFEASLAAAAKSAGRNLKIDLGSNARSINALSQPLGRITGQADEFSKSMEAANARVLAFGASVGVLNGVIQGFKALVTTTIEVEKSLADINTILKGSSQQLNQFKKDIFDVARDTGNSFKTVSDAALELSRQGLPANEVVRRLKDSMVLARLSGLDAAQAVEGLTAAVNSFSKEGLTTSQVLNKISTAAAKYSVSERDLIEGFKRSASVAQQAGVTIDELGGIITAVQQKTARGGAVIGNSFKTIFTRIQRPESLKLLEQVGVQVLDLQGNIVPATKLLEGLASKISSLSDIEVASITEKIGGGFQIAPLIAALDDYNSKTSVARGATEAFLSATNEAYQRNTALNQTMAAAINEASVNLKELANTLGEIGVTKGLSNVLSYFNTFISDIQGIFEGEGLGSRFAKSVVEGIGNVLSGPGLAIFGGIILKLTTDLVKFGTSSLKTFFNIGNAAKEINTLQGTIASTLLRNKDIQTQILALEGNRAAQARFFTTALNEQYSTMQKMQSIAASIAPVVYGGTSRNKRGTAGNAAGGYMPAVSQESLDISRGIGGARGGDRPVVIPNFAFGGGKKGTMVAHTGEYIVPNFAAGGSAIFNRDMIRSMGLPAGAKKIGAAGGFIPNFVSNQKDFNKSLYDDYFLRFEKTKTKDLETYASGLGRNKSPEYVRAAKDRLRKAEKLPLNQLIPINENSKDFGMIVGEKGSSDTQTRFADNTGKKPTPTQTENSKYRIQVPVYRIQDEKLKFREIPKLTENISKLATTAALKMAKGLSGDRMPKPENRAYIEKALNPGALGGTAGTIFEASIAGILNSNDFKDYEAIPRNSLIDFKSNFSDIRKLYSIPDSQAKLGIEAKGTSGDDLVTSAAEKFLKVTMGEDPFGGQKRKKAANGYIPNFANPLKEAIGREISAGVPASQIYVDQNSSLKSSMNPMGLMVANRRDEPAGGMQGINRARREGANPMMYGAASGFIPNYAESLSSSVSKQTGVKINAGPAQQAIDDFAKEASKAGADMKKLTAELSKKLASITQENVISKQLATAAQAEVSQRQQAAATRILESNAGKKLAAQLDKIYLEYNRSQKTTQDLQNAQAKAAAVLNQSTKLSQANRTAIVNSTAPLASNRQSAQVGAAGSRDMLGTIFAVQAGLSLLTGATNDSSSALARYTNVISNSLGNITTAAFAATAFKDMAGSSNKLIGVFGKLGVAGAALGGAFALFQGGKQLYYEYSGANKRAADAAKTLADSAEKAAVRLENLNPESRDSINRTVDDIIKKLNINVDEKQSPELRKAIATGLTGTSRKNVENILRNSLEVQKQNNPNAPTYSGPTSQFSATGSAYSSVQKPDTLGGDINKSVNALTEQAVSGQGAVLMRDYLSLIKESKTPEELTSFLSNPKLSENINPNLKNIPTADLFSLENINKTLEQVGTLQKGDFAEKLKGLENPTELTKSLAEQEATVGIIYDFLVKIRDLRVETEKNASVELSKQEQSLSKALQDSLKKSALERPTQIQDYAFSLLQSGEEISNKREILRINGDLSISEDLRKRRLEEVNHQHEITILKLENANKAAKELDSSLMKSLEGQDMLGIGPDNIIKASKEAKTFIQNFTSDSKNRGLLENLISGDQGAAGSAVTSLKESIKTANKEGGLSLFNYDAQQDDLVRLIKEYYGLSQNITIEEKQQINQKQKLFEISQKELSIEKQRQNLIERGNLYLKGAQNKLTSRIEDISNESTLNEAQKELELTIFDKTGKTVNPEENARAIEAINQKYFELQQKLNAEKAEAELRLEITRNLKIDNNIASLAKNTTAVGSIQNVLLDNIMPILSSLPENLGTKIKDAIIAANNGGQPVPQTASGGTQLDNNQAQLLRTLNETRGGDAASAGTVVGNQKLNELRNTISKTVNSSLKTEIKPDQMQQLAINARKFLGFDKTSIGGSKDGNYNTLYINGKEAPAGMRNNNPGNIIWGGEKLSQKYGSVATSINRDNNGKSPQLVFDDPLTGMTAAAQLALTKYNSTTSDFKSVNKIIAAKNGWTEGATGSAKNIAELMGVDPNQDIGLNDPKNLKNFLRSLTRQEHGEASLAYSDELINTAIENAIKIKGGIAQPATQPATNNQVITTNSKYGAINPEGTGGQYRIHPLSSSEQGRKLFNLMEEVSRSMGLQYKISSALQEAGKGTGSVRHNKEVGAADIKLIKNGQTVNFTTAEGEKIAAEFVKKLVAGGVTGVGAGKTAANYMGAETMHVGYGNPAIWGGTKKNPGPVPDWLRNSFTQGRREAGYTTSGISASALANKSLSTVDPIRQAAQRVSGFEIGQPMENAALKEAANLVDKTGKTTEDAKAQIIEMAATIEAAAISIISNGKIATTAAKQNRIAREKAEAERQSGTFADGFTEGMVDINKEIAGFSEQIGERIPGLFADNMAKAMEDAILNGEDLETSLRSAATSFLTEINKANLSNLANTFTSGIQQIGSSVLKSFASGGPITGGSGTKDDVPALLMGGEFVMNKKAVSRYGMNFMNQLNNGNLSKFADGGSVSDINSVGKYTIFSGKTGSGVSGQYGEDDIPRQYEQDGRFFSPGMYGSGAIVGKSDLLKFATQSQTSGKSDVMVNQNGLSYVSLEPESTRLTVEGRANSPEAQAVQRDKEEALSLYLSQYNAEQQAEEDYKAQKKAFRKALLTSLATTVLSSAASAFAKPAAAGFQAGMSEAASKGATGFSALGSGVKGIWSGGSIGGTQIGGLSNLFSGNMELANIGTASQLSSLYQSNPNSALGRTLASNSSNYISNISVPKAIAVNRATGGLIPNTSGVDNVPAMLTGGEFVMNRAATQNIGTGTLQSLNTGAGSNSLTQDSSENTEKIISKLDELIASVKENMGGNVSVNVSSDGSSTKEGSSASGGTTSGEGSSDSQSNAALTKKIKAAVIQVIQEEKRLGGTLRST